MDHLWSPWRYRYVTRAEAPNGCVFCLKGSQERDRENLVLHRATHCFVILNLFPYTSGHLMVIPYEHIADLGDLPREAARELMDLVQISVRCIQRVYQPKGLNIGMNIGECAGAGIAGHLHMHVLPRWPGDVNFMTSVAETRVLPEELDITYDRLLRAFSETTSGGDLNSSGPNL